MKQLTDLIIAHIEAGHSFMLLADARNYLWFDVANNTLTRYVKGKPQQPDAIPDNINNLLVEFSDFQSMAPRSFQVQIYPEYAHLMPVPQPEYDELGRPKPDPINNNQ